MDCKETVKELLLKFSLPGYYLFYSRLLRKSERISWLVVFPLAVLGTSIMATPDEWDQVLGVFSLSFVAWLSMYELGYMENDAFTVDQESQPTLRISREEIAFLKSNFFWISVIRLTFFLIITCLLWRFFGDEFSLTYYLLVIGLTRLIFYSHNQLRSTWNILSYFLLSSGKYLFLSLILFEFSFPVLLCALVLAFPLPRTLEHACKVKYGLRSLKSLVGEMDLFRLKYYGALVVFFGVTVILFPHEEIVVAFLLFAYFFLFRTFAWGLVRFGNYNRTEFKVHQWDKK